MRDISAACCVTVIISYWLLSRPERSIRYSRLSGSGRPTAGWKTVRLQPAGLPPAGGSERQTGDLWPLPASHRSPLQGHLDPTHAGGRPERVLRSLLAGEASGWLLVSVRDRGGPRHGSVQFQHKMCVSTLCSLLFKVGVTPDSVMKSCDFNIEVIFQALVCRCCGCRQTCGFWSRRSTRSSSRHQAVSAP